MLVKDLIKQLEKLEPNSNIGTFNSKDNFSDIDSIEPSLNLSYNYHYIILPKEN